MRNKLRAAWIGLTDGLRQPFELSSGMTYQDTTVQQWYDRSCNIGQAAGVFLRALRTLGADSRTGSGGL